MFVFVFAVCIMCAVASSSLSPGEPSAVEWVRAMVQESGGTELSLVAQELNYGMTISADEPPHSLNVRSLWRMDKERRIGLWKELQPQLQLHQLRLGGVLVGDQCPVDAEELAILCPLPDSLQELRELFLNAAGKLTDSGLKALASAGCGAQLTSLTLGGVRGVTDSGLKALASAGCGAQLTSLTLGGVRGVTDSGLKALASKGGSWSD